MPRMHRCRYNPAYWCVYVVLQETKTVVMPYNDSRDKFLKVLKKFYFDLNFKNQDENSINWILNYFGEEKDESSNFESLQKEAKKLGFRVLEKECKIREDDDETTNYL